MLEDLGSTNGTYLNRRRVTSPVELHRGDQVKIGKTVLEMRK
jgi:pSer/pThr/pTyr-binding forkhead associated (FHA) protein